jgi:sortase A
MNKRYYKKAKKRFSRADVKFFGLILFLVGGSMLVYLFFPLLSWQLYLAPVFASQAITIPIPKTSLTDSHAMQSVILSQAHSLSSSDTTNAGNWYPELHPKAAPLTVYSYTLSIPKLGIIDADVSTVDLDLSKHLVHYTGTTIPPDKGNAVIFGHSTIPQFYNPTDYKTIFANLYTIKTGDKIIVTVKNIMYTYKVFRITITDPDDTSMI